MTSYMFFKLDGTTGGVIVNNERIDDEKALIARAQWMF